MIILCAFLSATLSALLTTKKVTYDIVSTLFPKKELQYEPSNEIAKFIVHLFTFLALIYLFAINENMSSQFFNFANIYLLICFNLNNFKSLCINLNEDTVFMISIIRFLLFTFLLLV